MKMFNWVVIVIILASCDFIDSQEKKDAGYSRKAIPYDLLNPDNKTELPNALEEISGLAWHKGNFICINDEDGDLFVVSITGEVLSKNKFAANGDYEGVAVANELIYVVKSNGDLYRMDLEGHDAVEITTPLSGGNDVEGLTYDKENDRMLLANKDDAGIKKRIDGRAIYSFDPGSGTLSESPLVILRQHDLNQKILDRGGSFKIREFAPSGIAVHPQTNDIYIISHHGKALVVLNSSFDLLEVVRLSTSIFKQPEGICFSPDGTLYISNEGRGGVANILSFKMSPGKD